MTKKSKNGKREIEKDIKSSFRQKKWGNTLSLIEQVEKSGVGLDLPLTLVKAWCFLNQAKNIKELLPKKKPLLVDVIQNFEAIEVATESKPEEKISSRHGILLAEFLLGEKESAWHQANDLIKRHPNEELAWEAMADLCELDRNYIEAVKAYQEIYEIAVLKKDYQTASQAKEAKADNLLKLKQQPEAYREFQKALRVYRYCRRDSAKFSKETKNLRGKIAALEKKI